MVESRLETSVQALSEALCHCQCFLSPRWALRPMDSVWTLLPASGPCLVGEQGSFSALGKLRRQVVRAEERGVREELAGKKEGQDLGWPLDGCLATLPIPCSRLEPVPL